MTAKNAHTATSSPMPPRKPLNSHSTPTTYAYPVWSGSGQTAKGLAAGCGEGAFYGPAHVDAVMDGSMPHSSHAGPLRDTASYAIEGQKLAPRLVEGHGESGLNVPAAQYDPLVEDPGRDSELARPSRNGHSLAGIGDGADRPFVVGLLDACCPSAVAGLVALGVVDPVQRTPIRAWSHVTKEGFERVAPFWAHGNAARAVILISLAPQIKAALFGSAPGLVLGRLGAAMLEVAFDELISEKTAAAVSSAKGESTAREHFFGPTVASTTPESLIGPSWFGRSRLYYTESAESSASSEAMHVGILQESM